MERKLTPQELQRKERFEKTKRQLEQEGYTARNLIISIKEANIIGVLSTLPFVLMVAVPFILCSDRTKWHYTFTDSMLLVVLMLAGIVVHELIHGLIWGIFAKQHFRSISFGVIWKMLTPYCCCGEPLGKWQYIIGAAMPMTVLGGVAGIISVLVSNLVLWLFSMVMLVGGGGDLLIIIRILRDRTNKKEILYHDHPYEAGLVIFER